MKNVVHQSSQPPLLTVTRSGDDSALHIAGLQDKVGVQVELEPAPVSVLGVRVGEN